MSSERDTDEAEEDIPCSAELCSDGAAFWIYNGPEATWCPYCRRHTVELHPSIEVHTWLASGYGKPIELDKPTAEPSHPPLPRGELFRTMIDETMDWE